MFAVSENICIFVVPNHLNSSESDKTYRKTVYTTGSLSGDSTSVDSGGLATIQRGLVHSFFIHIINLVFSKMPNHQTKLTDLPNNSTQAVSTIHKFRIRITSHLKFINGIERTYTLDKEVEAYSEYEATGKVLKELSKLMPAGDVPLSNIFGTKSCVQLD